MPFYLRKSISAGPFRFNFSNGGVGMSVGVKGLRIGTGPRGHYVHAGRGGLHYRASLGRAGARHRSSESSSNPRQLTDPDTVEPVPGVDFEEIESGNVVEMRDGSFLELLNEINEKHKQARLSVWFGSGGAIIVAFSYFMIGSIAALGIFPVIGLFFFGGWIDSYRRCSVVYYDLEADAHSAYEAMTASFDSMTKCAGKWHVEASGAISDLTTWKRNAGASHLIKRQSTSVVYSLPTVIKSNLTPPSIHVGRQIMYFFPDGVLVQDGLKFGAVGYADLRINWTRQNFIEDERVPSDATIVSHTWKHPNKSGGPDRRFARNYQIPVCLYEVMHCSSDSGLNEMLHFSRVDIASPFAASIRLIVKSVSGASPIRT